MTDMDDKRLAVVTKLIAAADHKSDADLARDILAALDAHDAEEARGLVTEKIVEGARWRYIAHDGGTIESMRAALEYAAPLLARRARVPAVVTEEMVLTAVRAYQKRMGKTPWKDGIRHAIEAALAAAPRDPQPVEPVPKNAALAALVREAQEMGEYDAPEWQACAPPFPAEPHGIGMSDKSSAAEQVALVLAEHRRRLGALEVAASARDSGTRQVIAAARDLARLEGQQHTTSNPALAAFAEAVAQWALEAVQHGRAYIAPRVHP